ncbi:SRPBCC family protein [soil metagenome]
MSRIQVAIDIERSPTDVWQVVEPVETHVEWMQDAVRIDFTTDQRRGVGTRFMCRTKVGPMTLDDHMEITAWQPPTADEPGVMGVSHSGLVSGSGRFELSPIDDGTRTRFAWTEELRFPWWLGGPLGARVGAPVLAWVWRRNLAALKQRVEATPSSPPPG